MYIYKYAHKFNLDRILNKFASAACALLGLAPLSD